MKLTEPERELERSTAKAHGSLSLGMFAIALLVSSVPGSLWWIPFVVLGAVFALSSIYLAFLHKWKRKEILTVAATVQIKHVAWFLGLTALGLGLLHKGGAVLAGICILLAYAILIFGIVMEAKKTWGLKAERI